MLFAEHRIHPTTPETALVYLKARREEVFQTLVKAIYHGATDSEQRALVSAIGELDADIQRLEREAA